MLFFDFDIDNLTGENVKCYRPNIENISSCPIQDSHLKSIFLGILTSSVLNGTFKLHITYCILFIIFLFLEIFIKV